MFSILQTTLQVNQVLCGIEVIKILLASTQTMCCTFFVHTCICSRNPVTQWQFVELTPCSAHHLFPSTLIPHISLLTPLCTSWIQGYIHFHDINKIYSVLKSIQILPFTCSNSLFMIISIQPISRQLFSKCRVTPNSIIRFVFNIKINKYTKRKTF